VRHDDQRQAFELPASRERQIGRDDQPVARLVADVLDRCQGVGIDLWIGIDHRMHPGGRPVEQVIAAGVCPAVRPDQRTLVVLRPVGGEVHRVRQGAIELSLQLLELGIEPEDPAAIVLILDCIDTAGHRVVADVVEVDLGMLEQRLSDRAGSEIVAVQAEAAGAFVGYYPAVRVPAEDDPVDGTVVGLGELAAQCGELFVGFIAVPDRPPPALVRDPGTDHALIVGVPVPDVIARLFDEPRLTCREVDRFTEG
jgi:hypothetical protein